MLFIWNKGFDKDSIKEIMELTEEYSEKRIIVKNNKEIMKYIQEYLNAKSTLYTIILNHKKEK
jgi:hypothetical protein